MNLSFRTHAPRMAAIPGPGQRRHDSVDYYLARQRRLAIVLWCTLIALALGVALFIF